jgi:hypothetical protein
MTHQVGDADDAHAPGPGRPSRSPVAPTSPTSAARPEISVSSSAGSHSARAHPPQKAPNPAIAPRVRDGRDNHDTKPRRHHNPPSVRPTATIDAEPTPHMLPEAAGLAPEPTEESEHGCDDRAHDRGEHAVCRGVARYGAARLRRIVLFERRRPAVGDRAGSVAQRGGQR